MATEGSDEDEEEFETAVALKAWLRSKGVGERKAAEAAPILFEKDFDSPSSLIGISPDVLHRNGLSDAAAQTLSNKLAKPQQQQRQNAGAQGPGRSLDTSLVMDFSRQLGASRLERDPNLPQPSDIANLVPSMLREEAPELSESFFEGATSTSGEPASDEEMNRGSDEEDEEDNNNNNETATGGQAQKDRNGTSPADEIKDGQKRKGVMKNGDGERNIKRARRELWKATLKPRIISPLKSLDQFQKEICWYQGDPKCKLFVRDCTETCFNLIWKAIEKAKEDWVIDRPRFAAFVITGPPGLGKSWSSNFFVWHLLRKKQNIWFHSASDHKLTIIEFKDDGGDPQVLVKNEEYIIQNKVPAGAWFLYDSIGGTGSTERMIPFQKQAVGVPCVIFSSPKDHNYKQGLKLMVGGILWYLWTPAWEWGELNGVMDALFEEWGGKKRTIREFRDFIRSLFCLWGGIPRRFNTYTQDFRDHGMDRALQSSEADFSSEMKYLSSELVSSGPYICNDKLDLPNRNAEQDGSSKKANPPSWLVFPCPLKSEEDAFRERVYRFCSQRAELEFLKYLQNQSADVVRQFCKEVFHIPAANGIAFERFAHFVLTRTNENSFRWRKYAPEKARFEPLDLPKCETLPKCNMKNSLENFEEAVFNCIQKDKSCVIDPESDQQDAIDMFVVTKIKEIWHVLAMQDTISKTHSFHPVKILEYRVAARKAFERAKVEVKEDFFRHVVVVPSEDLDKPFSLLPAKHNDKSYWCPPQQTAASSTNTSKAKKVLDVVIDSVKDKCSELGLNTDFGSWDRQKAFDACKQRRVKNYRNLKCDSLRRVGAGAKLLADAEEKVKTWTWVLDGFFQ